MRKLLALLGVFLVTGAASAVDFTYDGIMYTITSSRDKTVSTKAGKTVVEDFIEWYEPGNTVTGALVIPDSVEYDGETYAVTSVAAMSFADNPELTSVTLPPTVTSIGSLAFFYCRKLESVHIPASVKTFGSEAFVDCTSLSLLDIDDIAAWASASFNGDTSNPLYFAGRLSVGGEEITSLEIPAGVTKISNYAFSGFKAMSSLNLDADVTAIGDYAFNACSGLTDVTFGPALKTSGKSAFYGCNSVAAVRIGGIEDWLGIAFAGSSSNPLGYGARLLAGDAAVTELEIPDGVTAVGNYAFYKCGGLERVTLPASVASLGEMAFYGCADLESITMVPGLKSMGTWTFAICTSLASVNLPYTLTDIPTYAFYGCSGLTGVTLPTTLTTVSTAAFASCENLKELSLPASLTSIGTNAFYNTGLTDVTVPSGSIGMSAFAESPVETVTLGSGVTTVSDYAFDCPAPVAAIRSAALTPPAAGSATFNEFTASFGVPSESRAAYAASTPCWSRFTEVYDLIGPESIALTDIPETQPEAGATFTLGAEISPADVSIPVVVWTSSNPAVASVDNYGNVTVYETGDAECVITAATLYAEGPSATYRINGTEDSVADNVIALPANGGDIFNLQGFCVKRNATEADVYSLAPGIYIFNGRKILVR